METTDFLPKLDKIASLTSPSKRQQSSRRLKYEAEAKLFQNRVGDLERIRQSLDLKPAQICRLLKVHPSAWIRWTRTKSAPPLIFQALEWYLELQQLKGGQTSKAEAFSLVQTPPPQPLFKNRIFWLVLVGTWLVQLLTLFLVFSFAKH